MSDEERENSFTNQLKTFITKRGIYKSQLTRFHTFLIKFKASTSKDFNQLQIRLQKLDETWINFNQIQTKIEILTDSDEHERESFEELYFSTTSEAKYLLDSHHSNTANALLATNHNNSPKCNVKLPPLDLPVFKGDYDLWFNFVDTFDALVNTNTKLSKVEKFYHLQNCLKGEAAQVIRSIEVTDYNYDVAWDLLRERYENKRLIVDKHIQSILELPIITRESHFSLRQFSNDLQKNIRSLKSLGQPVDSWDTIIIFICTQKLDICSRREWASSNESNEFPTLDKFTHFLARRCQILEKVDTNILKPQGTNYKKEPSRSYSHIGITNYSQNIICSFCHANHFNNQCQKFLSLPIEKRISQVKRMNLCSNCLRPGHMVKQCRLSTCKKCNKKHNTLLHLEENHSSTNSNSDRNTNTKLNTNHNTNTNSLVDNYTDKSIHTNVTTNSIPNANIIDNIRNNPDSNSTHSNEVIQVQFDNSTPNYTSLTCSAQEIPNETLLSTALINIFDSNGKPVQCRALLDAGSQSSFISQDLCRKLELKVDNINLPVCGISQGVLNITNKVTATIQSLNTNYKTNLTLLVIKQITHNIPQTNINLKNINIPTKIFLADPYFHISGPIDILLGVEVFWDLLCVGQIKLSNSSPIFQKTKLGWIVAGKIPFTNTKINNTQCNLLTSLHAINLNDQLENFWKLDEESECTTKKFTKEELECEQEFCANYIRDENGRFHVSLPTRDNLKNIGDTQDIAIKRFYNLERKLNKNPEFKQLYVNFMQEYLDLEHMSEINKNELQNDHNILKIYLPHHGVMRKESTTTKLRVVFDASARSDKNISLNDVLKTGPVIQDDLFDIILRFRYHNVVFIADIAKMYRQVFVVENQRNLQRIVWRDNPYEDLKHYKLNTVTYGMTSASFLAIRALHEVAYLNQHVYPDAAKIILSDFYVDDLISGTHSIEQAKILRMQIIQILKSAQFELRKWNSNYRSILLDEFDSLKSLDHYICENEDTKTLGLLWNSKLDIFRFDVNLDEDDSKNKITKRTILSLGSKIFDPMGMISPVTVRIKILLQKLWELKIGWDESVPQDIFSAWIQFRNDLHILNEIEIPRQVVIPNYVTIELHGFCDASIKAYGAALYIKTTGSDNSCRVQLLCSKSRIAPLKVISLPRLELCGALLLARLVKKVVRALKVTISKIYLWTDSTITLNWIRNESNLFKTFVANRVSEIQEITNGYQWNHVSSQDNPADIISRGIKPKKLKLNMLWWNGPKWLEQTQSFWPEQPNLTMDLQERKAVKQFSFTTFIEFNNLFNRFSKFDKLLRVTAYCIRFIKKLKHENTTFKNNIQTDELKEALTILIKIVQALSFAKEIRNLKNNLPISNKSSLLCLSPFLDENEILRVGGRISESLYDFDKIHPILLPARHSFCDLLIRYEHIKLLHAGTQTVLFNLRNKYWILNGKRTVKRIIRNCILCYKTKPHVETQLMGQLPKERLTPGRPFSVVGIDFAGPFIIKDGKLRTRKQVKTYLCIFICFKTKAVHFEISGDLSKESFLNTLKRFVARRGICKHIYSDNATNFIGADKELKKALNSIIHSKMDNQLKNYLLQNSIIWHNIPAKSPSFGGLWEAGVKSAKFYIKRVVSNALLTYEEFLTLVTQIEAVMNSRPITPISNDPNDFLALSPGHFLIGEPLVAIPENDISVMPSNRLSVYQKLQKMLQHFWHRWSNDYINNMQQKTKWMFQKRQHIVPGTLVILKEDNVPTLCWKMGRIVAVHPGPDNLVRVVTVRTSTGIYKRSIGRICILPIEDN